MPSFAWPRPTLPMAIQHWLQIAARDAQAMLPVVFDQVAALPYDEQRQRADRYSDGACQGSA